MATALPRTRIVLRDAEKEMLYNKSLATPGMALHRLGEWAMVELGLDRPLAVSTVAAVLRLQAARRAAQAEATASGTTAGSNSTGDGHDTRDSDSGSESDLQPTARRVAASKRRHRTEQRMRMTLQEKQELFAKYQATPDMKLRDLAEWAAQQFGLGRPPARSTVSTAIRHFESQPPDDAETAAAAAMTGPGAHNRDLLRKNVFKTESIRVEKELIAWIEACRAMGVCIQWSQVRAYASSVRDRLLEDERDPHVREKLEALQFSKGWLYRFQNDYGLIEYKRSKKPGSGYSS